MILHSALECDYHFKGNVDLVMKTLANILVNKSAGIDGIPIRFLKMDIILTCSIICHIINLSLTTYKVLTGLKKALVTPLYKAGNNSEAGNYRPVAILPAVGKIIERVVHNQIMDFMDRHNILLEAQLRSLHHYMYFVFSNEVF